MKYRYFNTHPRAHFHTPHMPTAPPTHTSQPLPHSPHSPTHTHPTAPPTHTSQPLPHSPHMPTSTHPTCPQPRPHTPHSPSHTHLTAPPTLTSQPLPHSPQAPPTLTALLHAPLTGRSGLVRVVWTDQHTDHLQQMIHLATVNTIIGRRMITLDDQAHQQITNYFNVTSTHHGFIRQTVPDEAVMGETALK